MTHLHFDAPDPGAMDSLLPAFEFKALIDSHDLGAVYVANQRTLDRDVAIKVLSPQISADPGFRSSFEAMARAMAQLNHPNLIRVFDSGAVGDMLYFVMEFVPGKSLERSSSGQHIACSQALELSKAICEGLENAHKHGIIHGNLDAASVLLNQKAQPKIGNFGFINPIDPAAGHTPTTAPEVVAGTSAPDQRSDVFSVAAILYQLLTTQPLTPDAPPASSQSDCPPVIDTVIKKATDPDPANRYPDIASLKQALESTAGTHARSLRTAANQPAPPAAGRPPASQRKVTSHAGHTSKLVRNLFIIAGLLVAIYFAWGHLETTRAARDAKQRELDAQYEAEKQKAIDEAKQRMIEKREQQQAALNPDNGSSNGSINLPEEPELTLDRLKNALLSGRRSDLPTGTIQLGEQAFFLVSEPMTWQHAAEFAEQHGGHLAVPNAEATVARLSSEFPLAGEVWLGAGVSGRKKWTLADGVQWTPAKRLSGTGQYLTVNEHGFLRAAKATETHPFIMQWHLDGKNPGTLVNLLEKTRESLSQPDPVFPPGTRASGSRHYCVINRPVTYAEAAAFASSAGGQLATASETAEVPVLANLTQKMLAPDGLWLGGTRHGETWTWTTGEPWKTAKWASNASATETDAANLVILPDKGWEARHPENTASGFIIEWDPDTKSSAGKPTPGNPATPAAPTDPGITALQEKATALVAGLEKKRAESLAKNAMDFTWDLDALIRSLNKGDQERWQPHATALKNAITDDRLPEALPENGEIQISAEMHKIITYNLAKQKEIDSQFILAVEKIRAAFAARVQQAIDEADAAGQRALSASLTNILDQASSVSRWTRSMTTESEPGEP